MQQRQTVVVLALVAAIAFGATFVFAAFPTAPMDLDVGLTSTMNTDNYAPIAIDAYAGNITALVIHGIGQTKSWQGYYGNITGTITLDDVNNFTFYNWSGAEPRGQVYATLNNTIAWSTVECFDYTANTINLTTMELFYDIQPNDADNVNVTFNQTDHDLFVVGFRNITGCPSTYIFQNDTAQQANFHNVLLWDITNNDTGWIYTTLIEDKTPNSLDDFVCYNGEYCDFQIIVNENGHGTDISPTQYYFWVELV
jgi:hypothetical protein